MIFDRFSSNEIQNVFRIGSEWFALARVQISEWIGIALIDSESISIWYFRQGNSYGKLRFTVSDVHFLFVRFLWILCCHRWSFRSSFFDRENAKEHLDSMKHSRIRFFHEESIISIPVSEFPLLENITFFIEQIQYTEFLFHFIRYLAKLLRLEKNFKL